jgi:hypothetical protein
VVCEIQAGACGFRTRVEARGHDRFRASFAIDTPCEKVAVFAGELAACGPVDVLAEIDPAGQSAVLAAARATLSGCCAACAVPVGVFKAMQVAVGFAPSHDVVIHIDASGGSGV